MATHLEAGRLEAGGEGLEAGRVGAFLKNNAGTIAAVGAVGAGAYLLTHKKKDDGSTAAAAAQAQANAQAWQDPNCSSTKAAGFPHCQKYLATFCAKTSNIDDVRCQDFSNTYCGLSATSQGAAEGTGTQLCKDAVAAKFCKMADTAKCRSCLSLNDRKKAICDSRPDICQREPTAQEMSYFKGVCPLDPVFSEPKWADIKAADPAATASTSNGGSSGSTSTTASTAGTTGASGSTSGTAAGTATTGSSTDTAVVNLSAARNPAGSKLNTSSDVAQAFGPGVFDNATTALQEVCKRAWLNGCGPRAAAQ